jgi:hypothetical protein
MTRTPPRVTLKPPFPPPRPGQPSPGAYALVRVCLGEACPLPACYRCEGCEYPLDPPVLGVA